MNRIEVLIARVKQVVDSNIDGLTEAWMFIEEQMMNRKITKREQILLFEIAKMYVLEQERSKYMNLGKESK